MVGPVPNKPVPNKCKSIVNGENIEFWKAGGGSWYTIEGLEGDGEQTSMSETDLKGKRNNNCNVA